MNVIIAYLETMFGAYPATPRMLEAKAELLAMMEDAYAAATGAGLSENEAVGKVITEFGNLDELAPVLGITREIHPETPAVVAAPALANPAPSAPAAAIHPGQPTPAGVAPGSASGSAPGAPAAPPAPAPAPAPAYPPITMAEATGYAAARESTRYRIALAVALFVVSPSLIITLPALAQQGAIPLTQGIAALIGILALFACVAAGVLTLVGTSSSFSEFARIEESRFTADPEVSRWATELARQHEGGRLRGLRFAVVLFILSPTPLIAIALGLSGSPYQGAWTVVGVVILLFIVALALVCILPASWAKRTAETLTGVSGDRSSGRDDHSIIGVIASFYWPILVVIYFSWSFIGNAWGHSWMVWPIGAVLFGAISAGSGALESYRAARR